MPCVPEEPILVHTGVVMGESDLCGWLTGYAPLVPHPHWKLLDYGTVRINYTSDFIP